MQIWTEDDLAARLRDGDDFEVHWTPADNVVPELSSGVLASGSWRPSAVPRAEQVSAGSGVASFRLRGEEPSEAWDIVAHRAFQGTPTRCDGFEDCAIGASLFVSLREGAE